MATSIELSHIRKSYGDTLVIPDLDLQVKEGEFFTLLGPSGCGKTTLLRMIAGFNQITSGTIAFDGTVINDLVPAKRNIGMVFQNYAVFPNMTVRGNILFGLKNRGLSKEEMRQKTDRVMDVVQIRQWENRYPKDLSGGQQQRVALARAIVIQPRLLLMDEPLSNLDAKLRVEMRNVVRHVQQAVGITTVYVTHDQEEAMAVSDRLAVMHAGVIEQVDTPRQVYLHPATKFVAGFIGRTNFFQATVTKESGVVSLAFDHDLSRLELRPELSQALLHQKVQHVIMAARPNEISFVKADHGTAAEVVGSTFLGESVHYQLVLTSGEHIEVSKNSVNAPQLVPGEQVGLSFNMDDINIFDTESGRNVLINDAAKREMEASQV
ncbi:ABC transporter ATP-binding protein [Bifidobacterium asteroides]|uniref:Polyamine ABC transporter ATP-binding protein n=1 Tax=Bifidobacterium asteroides TaxID=1684 RepID=A0A318MZ16_9BIFI|nr:ABC transporter ATP-binding protein [Bifidobacterium asteroides]PXY89538.1 polyamine ABC transporter ATP-binding protein [Bifidobacterium asteroides]